MSFREKSAWVSLLTYAGIYGYYFWVLSGVVAAGKADTFHYGRLLTHLIFLLVIVEIVLQIVVALSKPGEAQAALDEREKLIGLKATRIGFYVAMVGAATGTAAVAFGAPTFYTANGLFLVLVVAEMAKTVSQIVYYRLGA